MTFLNLCIITVFLSADFFLNKRSIRFDEYLGGYSPKPISFFFFFYICISVQAAEKEALVARHEEERVEQRRKAKVEKKAQKKTQKTNRTGDKRKAEDVGEDEWEEETGKGDKRTPFRIKDPCP